MRLRYRRKAEQDLLEVYAYSVIEWGVEAAGDYLRGLRQACGQLLAFPSMGRIAGVYRRVRYERHVVFCRLEGDDLIVVRVLHDRQLPPRHL